MEKEKKEGPHCRSLEIVIIDDRLRF